ncbi:Dabb family protein [Halalkalibaculum sp. DA3122]|uniref:Dabb family protein n=1 Tax=unclassified Halalkalibaculum TaxID=2964617 RepID=UPI0037541355
MTTVFIITSLAALAIPALAQQSPAANGDDEFFVHTVYFWLNNPESEADHQKLHEGLNKIAEIDLIEQAFVGVPADTDREVIDSSYDFSITFIFENLEDEQAYQTHPTHLEFVEEYSHLWKKVIVYDAVPPQN